MVAVQTMDVLPWGPQCAKDQHGSESPTPGRCRTWKGTIFVGQQDRQHPQKRFGNSHEALKVGIEEYFGKTKQSIQALPDPS